MSVKKIFIILITIVACVVLGAFVLNILMPNAATTLVDAAEDQIWKATGLSFDFNSNGEGGSNENTYAGNVNSTDTDVTGGVEGFEAAAG